MDSKQFCLHTHAGFYGGTSRGKSRYCASAEEALWMAMPIARRTLARLLSQGFRDATLVSREGSTVRVAAGG